MVGNNTVEDLAIRGLGADAFLVTDHLLDPDEGFDLPSSTAPWRVRRLGRALPACADPRRASRRASSKPRHARPSVPRRGAGMTLFDCELRRRAAHARCPTRRTGRSSADVHAGGHGASVKASPWAS
ncbi:MAG: hypothetical protein ACLSVD_03375 [Eggerthellaceae bacterium]